MTKLHEYSIVIYFPKPSSITPCRENKYCIRHKSYRAPYILHLPLCYSNVFILETNFYRIPRLIHRYQPLILRLRTVPIIPLSRHAGVFSPSTIGCNHLLKFSNTLVLSHWYIGRTGNPPDHPSQTTSIVSVYQSSSYCVAKVTRRASYDKQWFCSATPSLQSERLLSNKRR